MHLNHIKHTIFLLLTAFSLVMLGGCEDSEAESQIEQTVEIEDSTEETNEETFLESAAELTQEQQEVQNQDADPAENTEETPDAGAGAADGEKDDQAHTHTWVTETRYHTVHHDAVTHNENVTVTDQAAWDETVTTYTSEPQVVHHDAETHTETTYCETCRDCGAQFTDHGAAMAHLRECDHMSGLVSDATTVTIVDRDAWDETVYVQVPHTETIHHDAVTHVETKTVVDTAAYDEQVPYTVTVCSECGAEK